MCCSLLKIMHLYATVNKIEFSLKACLEDGAEVHQVLKKWLVCLNVQLAVHLLLEMKQLL